MPHRTVFAWTVMISAYTKRQELVSALSLFEDMVASGTVPNEFTFSSVIRSCVGLRDLNYGARVHGSVIKTGFEGNSVIGSSLIDLYSKCGKLKEARELFSSLQNTADTISWTMMIRCLVTMFNELVKHEMALSVINHMFGDGIGPDQFSLSGFISASANLGALETGKRLHWYSLKSGYSSSASVSNSLIDMYAKCGSLEDAKKVFEEIATPDVVSWNGLVSGLASNRCISSALSAFEEMRMKGTEPDSVTFLILLSACSNGRLTEMGLEYFHSMKKIHNIEPQIEHFVHLVDILGRAGRLEEAIGIIETMPLRPNDLVFKTLLRACRYHGNLSLGEDMANKGLALAPFDPAFYILLADLYQESGKPELAQKTRNLMSQKGLSKKLGQSSVEVQGKVHSFFSEDVTTVEKRNGIYAEIEWIKSEIKRSGFTYRGNENASYHSAKQAAVFGLVYTSAQTPVHVVKNKILCKDCHDFVSLVTWLVDKTITVRDGNRVHVIKNGKCSCKGEETSFVFS